jgi:hypothetical protein
MRLIVCFCSSHYAIKYDRLIALAAEAHALVAVHMKREQRRHREVVEAIRRRGVPPGYPRI